MVKDPEMGASAGLNRFMKVSEFASALGASQSRTMARLMSFIILVDQIFIAFDAQWRPSSRWLIDTYVEAGQYCVYRKS